MNSERRNNLSGLAEFIERWNRRTAQPNEFGNRNTTGRNRNINLKGSFDCTQAKTYTRWDADFESSLEPGVRRLVLCLIEKFDCITYSSCEGHFLPDSPKFSFRHVGIVGRSETELATLRRRFCQIAAAVNRSFPDHPIKIKINDAVLTSGNSEMPCLEIIFDGADVTHAAYFRQLDGLYDAFVKALENLA